MTELNNLIRQLQEELDRVVGEDLAQKNELPEDDVMYNEGWAGGMRRAITILKGAVSL